MSGDGLRMGGRTGRRGGSARLFGAAAVGAALFTSSAAARSYAFDPACSALPARAPAGAEIRSARPEPAHLGLSLGRLMQGTPFLSHPAICRVRGVIRNGGGEDPFELWLPRDGWTGELRALPVEDARGPMRSFSTAVRVGAAVSGGPRTPTALLILREIAAAYYGRVPSSAP